MLGKATETTIMNCIRFYMTTHWLVPLFMMMTFVSFKEEYMMLYDEVQVEYSPFTQQK